MRHLFSRVRLLSAAIAAVVLAPIGVRSAGAAQITFTGGDVYLLGNPIPVTTNNAASWDNVDYYEEDGFRLDFLPNAGSAGFATHVGDYYGVGNDVIHGHWATGSFGGLTQILVTKIDGTAFDLNYFVLTSNTEFGGGPASGNERAFIHASGDGVSDDYSQLLPSEDWGFPATQVFLGSQFDSVKAFWFDVENHVDCFGMDNFFINEPGPGVPLPAAAWGGLAMLGAVVARKATRRVGRRA